MSDGYWRGVGDAMADGRAADAESNARFAQMDADFAERRARRAEVESARWRAEATRANDEAEGYLGELLGWRALFFALYNRSVSGELASPDSAALAALIRDSRWYLDTEVAAEHRPLVARAFTERKFASEWNERLGLIPLAKPAPPADRPEEPPAVNEIERRVWFGLRTIHRFEYKGVEHRSRWAALDARAADQATFEASLAAWEDQEQRRAEALASWNRQQQVLASWKA